MAGRALREMIQAAEDVAKTDATEGARLLRKAALRAASSGDLDAAVAARTREALAWSSIGRVADARSAVRAAMKCVGDVVDDGSRLVLMSNLGIALTRDAGLHSEAINLLRHVVESRRQSVSEGAEASRPLSAALVNLAVALTDSGRAAEALAVLVEALHSATSLADPAAVASVRMNEGTAYSALHRHREAAEAYAAAADRYVEANASPSDVAYALRGQAAILSQTARWEDAMPLYERATRLFEHAEEPVEVFRTQMGAIAARGRLRQTIPDEELLTLESGLQSVPLRLAAEMSRNLGNVWLNQGDPAAAMRLYSGSRRSFRRLDSAADVASVEMNMASLARLGGDFARARQLLLHARRLQIQSGRWLSVAHIDHNLALLMRDIADQSTDGTVTAIRTGAARARQAVAGIDRYRHDLASADDRRALVDRNYPAMFPIAIELALRANQPDSVAALVERARVQPVLASRDHHATFYAEPLAVAAHAGDKVIGVGQPVILEDEARRLAGRPATWLGVWGTSEVVSSATTPSMIAMMTRPAGDEMRRLHAALPIPRRKERELAGNDSSLLGRLVMRRVALGPLLRDLPLANRLDQTLRQDMCAAADEDPFVQASRDVDDAKLLWPLTRLLVPPRLLADIERDRQRGKRPALVIAPPTPLGHVPWAALPVADPAHDPTVDRLIDVCDIVVALPISLSAAGRVRGRSPDRGRSVLVADPLGDLPYARRLVLADAHVLGHGRERATTAAITAAASRSDILVIAGHVEPGTAADPTASAILVRGDTGDVERLTVRDLADVRVPPTCVVLGCDSAGAATGAEWAGVATGLVWAGAEWVVTTTWPMIDDNAAVEAENELISRLRPLGAREAVWSWQRDQSRRWRFERAPEVAPCRWAGVIVTGSPAGTG